MTRVGPVERRHETVARLLRGDIIGGRYQAGDRLPIERELGERFGVSRSVVRQALLILGQQGLVRVRPGVGGGPFVAQETMPAAMTAFENMLSVDPTSVADFAQAKCLLEPVINEMVAEEISDDRIAALENNILESRAALDRGDRATDLMIDFHTILANSTGNRFLALIVELMARTLDRIPDVLDTRNVDPGVVLAEHEQMLEALRRRDGPEVRRLTVAHLAGIWQDDSTVPSRSCAPGAVDRHGDGAAASG